MIATRQQILDYARTLIGTPFHHQGRLPGVGLDCIGVLVCICRQFGISSHDFKGYPRQPDGVTLQREFAKGLETIPAAEVQPGDVLSFWIKRPGWVQHCALATDYGMLHTWATVHKVVEHVMDARWQKHLAACYRFPGINPTPYPKAFAWAHPLGDPQMTEVVKKITQPCVGCGG